jgi:hypothetical protein
MKIPCALLPARDIFTNVVIFGLDSRFRGDGCATRCCSVIMHNPDTIIVFTCPSVGFVASQYLIAHAVRSYSRIIWLCTINFSVFFRGFRDYKLFNRARGALLQPHYLALHNKFFRVLPWIP